MAAISHRQALGRPPALAAHGRQRTLDGLPGRLEAQANVLVPAQAVLAGHLLHDLLAEAHIDAQLLLEALLRLQRRAGKGLKLCQAPRAGPGSW